MTVLVLQAFTVEGGASGSSTQNKAAGQLVSCGPEGIARALETKHGIEDVERNHRFAMRGVGRTGRGKGSYRTGFIDSFVQDLPIFCFLV